MDELAGVRGELARLVLRGPGRTPLGEFEQAVAALENREQQLEASLSQQSREYRAQALAVTIAAVRRRCQPTPCWWSSSRTGRSIPWPSNATRVLALRAMSPSCLAQPARRPRSTSATPRRSTRLSIGFAGRCAIPRTAGRSHRAEVDATVMAPVRARLASHTKVFLAPDAALNLCRLPHWSTSSSAISWSATPSPISRAAATCFSCWCRPCTRRGAGCRQPAV